METLKHFIFAVASRGNSLIWWNDVGLLEKMGNAIQKNRRVVYNLGRWFFASSRLGIKVNRKILLIVEKGYRFHTLCVLRGPLEGGHCEAWGTRCQGVDEDVCSHGKAVERNVMKDEQGCFSNLLDIELWTNCACIESLIDVAVMTTKWNYKRGEIFFCLMNRTQVWSLRHCQECQRHRQKQWH